MKQKVYLDTSVVSALFDSRTPERMEQTTNAWAKFTDYQIHLSDTVVQEISNAPPPMQELMFEAVSSFTVLSASPEAIELASIYIEQGIFPHRYFDDALHVAIASVNNIGILLSWNFSHLVKLKTRRLVALINTRESHIIMPPGIRTTSEGKQPTYI